MERYKVFIKPSAVQEIEAIEQRADRQGIVRRIRDLAIVPRPSGCEKLMGPPRYRIRQGRYRVAYAVEDDERSVHVVEVGHKF